MFDQTERVYAFENNHVEPFDNSYLSSEEIKNIIIYVSNFFSISKPKVVLKKTDSHCRAFIKENKIVITDWGRTYTTVLHEISHLIDYQLTRCSSGPHGPTFVGISIFLYAHFLGVSKMYLYDKAKKMGVEFIDFNYNFNISTPKDDFFDGDF